MNTDGREVVNLNREWTYQRGDHPGAERTDYDRFGMGAYRTASFVQHTLFHVEGFLYRLRLVS